MLFFTSVCDEKIEISNFPIDWWKGQHACMHRSMRSVVSVWYALWLSTSVSTSESNRHVLTDHIMLLCMMKRKKAPRQINTFMETFEQTVWWTFYLLILSLFSFSYFVFSVGDGAKMSRRTNVTKLFSLAVILHLVVASGGTDVSQNSADNNDNEISRGGRKVQNFTEIANRLMQIRGLLKQLFSAWNAGSDAAAADARVDGESEIEGKW